MNHVGHILALILAVAYAAMPSEARCVNVAAGEQTSTATCCALHNAGSEAIPITPPEECPLEVCCLGPLVTTTSPRASLDFDVSYFAGSVYQHCPRAWSFRPPVPPPRAL